jgi:hypothetical protein
MKYKASKDYDKAEKNLASFGDYQKHSRLVRGKSIELDNLPDEYKELVEPVSKAKKKIKEESK